MTMQAGRGFGAEKAGAFDFSSLATRLNEPQLKSSFKDGTLHAYAELGDIEGLTKLIEIGKDEGKPSSRSSQVATCCLCLHVSCMCACMFLNSTHDPGHA